MTNNLSGYLDFNLMNAAIEEFEGNGVVIRIDLLDAEKNELQPYQIFMVREGSKKAFFE